MDHLSDYVRWMQDFPISMTGFRDEDAVILCALSYFDLSPLFSSGSECPTVRDCGQLIKNGQLRVLVTGSSEGYPELLAHASASRRFGDLRLLDYVDTVRQDPPLQFSAVCFQDSFGFAFLAYRGTDNSLAGWKEDFMISFTRTEAQELALRYAEAHVLYFLDGPGFCPEVLDQSLLKRVDPKAVRILPSFCIIGNLFAPQITDTRIVRSFAGNYSQHAPITWGIDHGRLALAKEHDRESQIISDTLNEWVSGISQEDRLLLTEELFQVLTAGGAETVEHLQKGGFDGLEAILRQFVESSEATRNILSDLPKVNWKIRMEALRRRMKKDSPEE